MRDSDIFVNMNVKLRKGGRTAVQMSMDDFEDKIEQICMEMIGYDDMYYFIQHCCWENPTIKKDMKVRINMENMECSFRMTSTGVPYLLVEAASDYSPWMVFMLYWDGKKLRAYIPTYGNTWNTKTKEQLGENPEEDSKFIISQINKEDFDIDWDDIDDPEELCCELIPEIWYNEKACIEDFESRLTVK